MSWDLKEAVGYYQKLGAPRDQSALIALLREAQQENGGSVPAAAVTEIAQQLQTQESLLLALIRRIPSLRLGSGHTLELCCGPNCGKALALAARAEALCRDRKDISLKFVPCMRMCGKGPNLKWDGQLRHKATPELLEQLLQTK